MHFILGLLLADHCFACSCLNVLIVYIHLPEKHPHYYLHNDELDILDTYETSGKIMYNYGEIGLSFDNLDDFKPLIDKVNNMEILNKTYKDFNFVI